MKTWNKILNIANTPFELYYLSGVACLLKEIDPKLEIKLWIRKEHRKKISPEIAKVYSEILAVDFPTLTFPLDKNPIKLFINFFKNLYQTLKFRNFLKNYSWDINIICISSFREFFANMICRQVPKNIRLIALRMANEGVEKLGSLKKRPLLAFLLNLKNFFFGFSLMDYQFRTDVKEAAEKNFKKNPYHRIISITDHDFNKENGNWRLFPPFLALKKIYPKNSEPPAILVVGERTPLYSSWSEKDDQNYQEFLDYLRKNFENYKLYFKPRENLTDLAKFDLKNFEILPAGVPLEEFCLRKNIVKVIAIKSTSAKVGAYFEIPSYLIYPKFNLPQNFKEIFEKYFEDMHSIVRVREWSDLKNDPKILKPSIKQLTSLYWKAVFK